MKQTCPHFTRYCIIPTCLSQTDSRLRGEMRDFWRPVVSTRSLGSSPAVNVKNMEMTTMSDAKATIAEVVDAVVKSVQPGQPGRRPRTGAGYDHAEKVGLAEELALATYRNSDAADGYRYSLNSARQANGRSKLGNSYDVESLFVEPLRIEVLLRYFTTRREVSAETKTLLLEFMKHLKPALTFARAYVQAMATDEGKEKPANGRAEESPERQSA